MTTEGETCDYYIHDVAAPFASLGRAIDLFTLPARLVCSLACPLAS